MLFDLRKTGFRGLYYEDRSYGKELQDVSVYVELLSITVLVHVL